MLKADEIEILKKYSIPTDIKIDEVLDAVDLKMLEIGFDENDELTEEGLKLQLMYDKIYMRECFEGRDDKKEI